MNFRHDTKAMTPLCLAVWTDRYCDVTGGKNVAELHAYDMESMRGGVWMKSELKTVYYIK